MIMRQLPFETMYVEWTVRGIVDYFKEAGFSVYSDTVQEIAEAKVPIDRVLAVTGGEGVRVFAFQFKAPEIRGGHIFWRLATSRWRNQLDLMRDPRYRSWIWYALPYFTKHTDQIHALHLCHFVPPGTLCEKVNFICWNGEILFHFPCNIPRDLAGSEMPLSLGNHCGHVELFKRTIEIRPNARQVCGDPLFNIKESWGTLLKRMEQNQFGLQVKESGEIISDENENAGHPLHGPGCAIALDTIRRVVGVVSLMLPPIKPEPDDIDIQMLNFLGSPEKTEGQ